MNRTILWTGGLDSTYLVVDALLAGDTVSALTWTGGGRLRVPVAKASNEAEARARVTGLLPAELLPRLSAETFSDRQVDAHFDHAYAEMLHAVPDHWWSPQNYVLAALARVVGRAEAGLVADDPTARLPGITAILGRDLDLPLLGRRKRDLYADARARGFAGVLDATWTCEWVGRAEAACGTCKACELRRHATAAAA